MSNQDVEIPTSDGEAAGYLCRPEGRAIRAGVILFMDALGFRPTLRRMGERLAHEGYLVLIPDLFYRWAPYGPFDPEVVFRDPEALRAVGRLNRALAGDLFAADAPAYLDFLAQSGATDAVGAVGYCMGGRCSLALAGLQPERVAMAASFHGGELATSRAGSPHTLAARIRAKVYIGVAEIDQYFHGEEEGVLASALRQNGVDHVIETFRGTQHGFAIADTPAFHPAGAEKHWLRLLSLLEEMPAEPAPKTLTNDRQGT